MDQILASVPKAIIAIVCLVVALLVIRQIEPPRTVCDAQMEVFRDSQKRFLYAKPSANDYRRMRDVKQMFEECSGHNSPGGCFEYFQYLKKVLADLDDIPSQCAETASSEAVINEWVWKSLTLMVQMAWGDRAPASYVQRNGWFDTSELTLFCSTRKQAIRIFGQSRYSEWQEGMLKNMPNSEILTRDQVWQRSILSTPCDVFR